MKSLKIVNPFFTDVPYLKLFYKIEPIMIWQSSNSRIGSRLKERAVEWTEKKKIMY